MNYGKIQYRESDKTWVIECEPHVAIRLKRVFGKVDRRRHGSFALLATPENTRDLEWFIERYPMEVLDGDRLRSLADSHRERESLIQSLLNKQVALRAFDLAVPLREYQKEAAQLALLGKGLLLADDVGLGKSASAIGMLTEPSALPALVVTLSHLPLQWQKEVEKFAPNLTTHIIKKGQPYDIASWGRRSKKNQPELAMFPDVTLINYHKLSGWASTLAPLIRTVIFDEVQEVRRSDSNKYAAALHLAQSAEFSCGLSATPIFNYGGEIFNVMQCVAPAALGAKDEFINEWCTKGGFERADQIKVANPKALGSYLRNSGLMLRRTRTEVGRELPGCSSVPYAVDCDSAALESVSFSCRELAKIILAQGEGYRGQKMHASEEFSNKLRQATGISKAPYVADFVRLLVEAGEKIVLYAWHREVYSILQDRLKEFMPVMYTGSESPTQKEKAKTEFIEGEARVMMISLRAGAGLDGLQKVCRTAVFGELDWSPGVHEQCTGRIFRDGQKDPVVAYYLLSEEGSDPIVADTLGLKRQQAEGLRGDERELIEKLQSDGGHIRKLAEAYLGIGEQREEAVA